MIFNETKIHGSVDFPIELYHIDHMHPRYEMVHHWHKNIEIIRVLEGKLNVTLDYSSFIATKGDIVFVNPETVHGASPVDDCVYECVVYDPELVPSLPYNTEDFNEALLNGSIHLNEKISENEKELSNCVDTLFNTLCDENDGTRFIIIGMLCNIYGIILKNKLYKKNDNMSVGTRKPIANYKKVIKYIRNSYSENLSLEDMARCAGMSKKYFCTFFKQFTHQTPFEYLISYRIERAVQFLLTTEKSITDIAYSCGFNDLSYFIKTFKNLKGMSPGQMRRDSYRNFSLSHKKEDA